MDHEPFGRTGHDSSRMLFGAAALGAMRQEKADQILDLLLAHGVNHIDTAASYGDSELRVGAWMARHRDRFFLATKTGDRTVEGARASIQRSLERLGVDRIDLIQLHNLVDETEWATALGPGGALEALVEARERGQVRFLGVTGHGTRAAEMHCRSLERFPFDSVLLPYSFVALQDPAYRADVEELLEVCAGQQVAVQTIKSVARRRWRPDHDGPRYSWYEPLRDPEAIGRAVRWVLANPAVFLLTSSDANVLPTILEAAATTADADAAVPTHEQMHRDVAELGVEPLFDGGTLEHV
jgi:aryl-alcohol dehydrogenase-like predicted oxidoreductase